MTAKMNIISSGHSWASSLYETFIGERERAILSNH
jgi:hypothetical protein